MSINNNQASNTSKVVKGMSSQTVVTLVLGVVEIVSFSIMSRLLTQDDFGYYAAITAITIVFSTFSETGIGSAIIQQKELTKRYVDNAFTISFLFGSFISLLLFVLAGPLSRSVADESMKFPLMLMSGTMLLHCLSSVNLSLMHRKLQFLRIGSIKLVAQVITTGIAIFLAYKGMGYYAIITKAILYSVLVYILSLFLCKTKFGFALDKGTFKRIFSFSGWLMASSLFRNLSHEIDRLLMPRLLSVTALGAYNRPKDFVEQMSSKLNGIFDSALFPVLSSLQDNKKALESAYRRSLFLMNVFALLVTMGFMFNSELLIRIFFGEQWINLRSVMLVISCSLLFNFDGRLADCYLRSLAMTKQQFYFRIFETVLKTVGVLIGFKWDIIGVAISVVITNSLAKLIKIFYIGVNLDLKIIQVLGIIVTSWRYGVLMIPICVVAYVFLPHTWGGDILNAIIYIVITLVVFFFLPNLVGKQYHDDVYVKVIAFINKKFHLRGHKNEI
jgi:PST family polysaccharide transporter